MQLLVSVRSAVEVAPALDGGADIIDAKEPGRGSLGPVPPATLAEIAALVPPERPLSIALGDLASSGEAVAAIAALELPARPAPTYLKLGFAGVRSPEMITRILASAVAAVSEKASAARVVAVAYADADRASTVGPDVILDLAGDARAAGVLLDTHTKDGIGLLGWLSPSALAGWVALARRRGLLTALAGTLTLESLESVHAAGADIVGVRGAACEGGREGRVEASRVRELRQRLDGFRVGCQHGLGPGSPDGWRNAG
ncbi:MAG TPA: (5-formylfuran-3-yl)methyl phosphate synthase [Gemmatimonadales bacterium]|nr:(5-formylfuran-3-yl)methyl phosphate synthase [Gemmatimonadales bacterium]